MEKVEKKGIGKRKDLVLLITVGFIVPTCPLSAKCGGKKASHLIRDVQSWKIIRTLSKNNLARF